MRKFMDDDFLLETETGRHLYENFAKNIPIIDYHCHIPPREIAEDIAFENITQLWLGADHYKWRQMRTNGVEEKYITGDATDKEKFQKWAETLELLIGNPLYHWSHLELRRYFGIEEPLTHNNWEEVWNLCNEKLKDGTMTARQLIKNSGVRLLCTTDDPIDSLEYHARIREDETFSTKVLPAWRPDKVLNIEKGEFGSYIEKLEKVCGFNISTIEELKKALLERLEHFQRQGCSVSDHGMDHIMYCLPNTSRAEETFLKKRSGEAITEEEADNYKMVILSFLAREYTRRNWVMEIHFGVKRDNNPKMYEKIGKDTGFDCMHNQSKGKDIANFLGYLSKEDSLPKTILYSLNPCDDDMIGSIIGCFQDSSCRGKIQQGSGWWFNDNKSGMIKQMTALGNLGMLSTFVGMLTDSRSLLSYTRHEYFRRILCNLVGKWVENGEYPYIEETLGKIIKDISYNNCIKYFDFDLDVL